MAGAKDTVCALALGPIGTVKEAKAIPLQKQTAAGLATTPGSQGIQSENRSSHRSFLRVVMTEPRQARLMHSHAARCGAVQMVL